MPFYEELENFEDVEETEEAAHPNPKASMLERNRKALTNFILWRKRKVQKEQVVKLEDLPRQLTFS